MKNGLICSRITTESKCIGMSCSEAFVTDLHLQFSSNCQWVTTVNRCRANPEYTAQLLVSDAEDPAKDPVCLSLQQLSENGCTGVDNGTTCIAKENCQWYPESNCKESLLSY